MYKTGINNIVCEPTANNVSCAKQYDRKKHVS